MRDTVDAGLRDLRDVPPVPRREPRRRFPHVLLHRLFVDSPPIPLQETHLQPAPPRAGSARVRVARGVHGGPEPAFDSPVGRGGVLHWDLSLAPPKYYIIYYNIISVYVVYVMFK